MILVDEMQHDCFGTSNQPLEKKRKKRFAREDYYSNLRNIIVSARLA